MATPTISAASDLNGGRPGGAVVFGSARYIAVREALTMR